MNISYFLIYYISGSILGMFYVEYDIYKTENEKKNIMEKEGKKINRMNGIEIPS